MAKKRSTAGGRPAWLKDMYDIIDGRYDDDTDTIDSLIDAAKKDVAEKGFVFTCSSPAMATKAVRQAAEHRVELLDARVKALKAQSEEIEADVQHKREVCESLEKALEEAYEKEAALQEQLTEKLDKLLEDKSGKTVYQRLEAGEFNSLHYTLFFEILKR